MKVKLKGGQLPERGTIGSAGLDLFANQEVIIPPAPSFNTGEIFDLEDLPKSATLIPVGCAVQLPEDSFGLIKDRSSIARKRLTVGAGVIDWDYRGEIKIVMYNLNNFSVRINAGDKIAQMIVLPYINVSIEKGEVNDTARGSKGFGSTG